MDYSNSNGQQSSTEGENKSSVFGSMWDGLKSGFSGLKNKVTGIVSASSTEENPNPPTGGKGRKHKKSMKGGKSKKRMSSKSRKGKGKKRTYGRK
jgi:hypothetical protein